MREAIHDNTGFIIGYIEQSFSGEVQVYDSQGYYLGHAKPGFGGGTYDSNGFRISTDFVPTLLLN
jgi:hypothetical protein